MRILLKFEIDCDVDAAWRALHSPRVLAELYGPLIDLRPLGPMPTSWEPGNDVTVQMALGPVPLGRQLIDISERSVTHRGRQVRILRDTGIPLTGALASLDVWDHQMAVSETRDGRTLWRDRLVFGGRTAPLLWPALWTIWQWRQARIIASARTWSHDVDIDADADQGDGDDADEAFG